MLDEERAKLIRTLDALDREFEEIEAQRALQLGSDASSNPADALQQEDDDLLIQKLEQESAYLTKLLLQADDDNIRKAEEVKQTTS